MMPKDQDILTANLARLRVTEPQLAGRLEQTPPASLQWVTSRKGPLSASTQYEGRALWLASRFDPAAEAKKLVGVVDHAKHACTVILGMGLGYHVSQIAQGMHDTQSLMIVYEPDAALVRAVMEKIDHRDWLGRSNILVLDDQVDRASLLKRIEPFFGMLTQGTILVTHPPSRRLHEQAFNDFGKIVTQVMEFCRTNVATALVNASRTYRNLSVNLHRYAAGANTNELFNAARGYPAVCIGAGPSLTRNIDLLTDAQNRSRVVVVTAQTMLKPLLDHGIKPDFVTALDYHEISARFYEGITDLSDTTLVAQPLVHPVVLDRYPGPIRVTQSSFLDLLLGDQAPQIQPIPHGATVSHLSFYLAQHLGCDPIIFIGMDLGFSNGLYYFPGTAIHDVWAPELGAFNTLEMMEWQRIVRHRNHLQKLEDIHGQPIYSDDQMLTYLKQFERDFTNAPQQILDATEGGLPKQHTTRVTLARALADHATRPVPALPQAVQGLDPDRLGVTAKLLGQRRAEVSELRRLSRETIPLLRKMVKHQRNPSRMDKFFAKLRPIQRRVDELSSAFSLVNNLNTVGAFKRARADRAIDNTLMDEYESQRRRLERDIENVDWLAQACDELLDIIHDSLARVEQSKSGSSAAIKGPNIPQQTAPS